MLPARSAPLAFGLPSLPLPSSNAWRTTDLQQLESRIYGSENQSTTWHAYTLSRARLLQKLTHSTPITCLTVIYKTLTSVIKQRIEGHLSQGNLMASEQKGCQQGSFGAKDHLLLNILLTEDCKARHRSLSMAWVDYQKAYDTVPHSWVLQCLQLHKISPVLCRFLSRVMEGWRTSMVLSHGKGTVKTRIMQIRRGIFQGDSLSPLLFCMALNALRTELNRTGCGYRMSTGNGRTAKRQFISLLLYMDDLKLYGRNPDQLDGLLHTVRTFSDDIRMKFGLDKCAIAQFVNGKLSGHNPGVKVGKTETIKGWNRVKSTSTWV